MSYIILSIFIGMGLTSGDILMKKWMLTDYSFSSHGLFYLISSLLIYSISLIGYGFLLKSFNLNVATLIVVSLNVLIVMLVGILFFDETLSLYHAGGSLLCFIGLCIILLK